MALTSYYVIVSYNLTTGEVLSVSKPFNGPGVSEPLTLEQIQKICDDLNPDDASKTRCRVGTLTVDM